MQLIAEKREELGKKTKKLRREQKVPVVIFGKDLASVPLTVGLNDFNKIYEEAGETNLIDLTFEGGSEKVLISDVQYNPVSSQVMHVNFHKVNLKEKITAEIPVEVVGEDNNDLIKSGEALILVLMSDIEVEALPTDLPNMFEVDVSGLTEIGGGLTVASLKYDKDKVEIQAEEDELVVKLDYAVQEEEEEEELSEEDLLKSLEVTEETEEDEETAETTSGEQADASE